MARSILHVDMDAFFAAVEQRDNPKLRGKPVIVGGSGARGVVSTASYEARVFGVHSAQPGVMAKKLCPHGIFVRPRMKRYSLISQQIREIFLRFTPLVEPLSLDEAFLDVTGSKRLFGTGQQIGELIRAAIQQETRLTASVGVATCKFIAKIASDFDKPDGLTEVEAGTEREFLDPLPISRMWGVGPVAQERLSKLGFRTFSDLTRADEKELVKVLGVWGARIRRLAHAMDNRPVVPNHQALSIGSENTFGQDLVTTAELRARILDQTQNVGKRLRRSNLQTEGITLKVKLAQRVEGRQRFKMLTRSTKLSFPASDDETIFEAAMDLLSRCELKDRPVRLTGVSLSRLTPVGTGQLPLDEELVSEREKRDRLMQSVDAIQTRFGKKAIRRAQN